MRFDCRGPDFLIAGAQKAGTTSLYEYLVRHPNVLPADEKELHFFDIQYHKGWDWYCRRLQGCDTMQAVGGSRQLQGEASPYYLFHPLVPGRILRHAPNTRFIVVLRNPIDRAYSHYHHEIRLGFETLSFEDALASEQQRLSGVTRQDLKAETACVPHQHHSYQARGHYAEQLAHWWQHFSPRQFLVLFSDVLHREPVSQLRVVYEFLGLPERHLGPYPKSNDGGKYAPMRPITRVALGRHFAPYNRDLAKLLRACRPQGSSTFSSWPDWLKVEAVRRAA